MLVVTNVAHYVHCQGENDSCVFDVNNQDPNYKNSAQFLSGTPIQVGECAIKELHNHWHDTMNLSTSKHRPASLSSPSLENVDEVVPGSKIMLNTMVFVTSDSVKAGEQMRRVTHYPYSLTTPQVPFST